MSPILNSPCINRKSARRTCNLGVVVHFNLEKINESIKLLRNPIYNHIYVKKTLYGSEPPFLAFSRNTLTSHCSWISEGFLSLPRANMSTSSPTKTVSGGGGGVGAGATSSGQQSTSTRTPTSDFYRLAESGSSKALTAFGLAGKGGRESRKHRQAAHSDLVNL